MKRQLALPLILLTVALFFSEKSAACGYNFIGGCSSDISLRINGHVTKFNLASCYGTQLNGLQLGEIQSLGIHYGFAETWESCINNVSGMVLCYRITAQGYDAGDWQFWPLSQDSAHTTFPYTARYFSRTGETSLTQGLELGRDYVLEMYLRADIDTIGDDFTPETVLLQNNAGRNYTLTFRYGGPTAAPFVVVPGPYTPPSCAGRTDGNVSVRVFGDLTNLNYQWSSPAPPIPTRYNIGTGVHTVTVSNGTGAEQVVSLTLYPPEPVAVFFPTVRPFGCGSNGLAQASGSGGNAPYTYVWNTGSTSAYTAVATAGMFTVTISDAGGCTQSGSVAIPGGGTVKKNITATICPGGVWQSGSQTYSQPGTYSYHVPGTTCDTTVTLTLRTITPSDGLVGLPNHVPVSNCAGAGPSVCAVTAPGFDFLWKKNGETTGASPCFSGLPGGNYTVQAFQTRHGLTCLAEQSVQYAQGNFTASVGGIVQPGYCNPTGPLTVQLAAATNAESPSFEWIYNGQTFASDSTVAFTVTIWKPDGPLLPTLIVRDTGSCQVLAESNVTWIPPTPYTIQIAVQNTAPGQNNGSLIAQPTGGMEPYRYAWNNGASTSKIEQLPPGIYCLTVTDLENCTRTQCATVSTTSPTMEVENTQKIKVFPNPAAFGGVLQAEVPADFLGGNILVKILDLQGRAFVCNFEQTATNQLKIALPSDLPTGLYLLTITEGNQTTNNLFEVIKP